MTPASEYVIEVTYIVAAVLFILALKWLSSPVTARRGVWAGEVGMVLAVAGTLLYHGIVDYKWIAIALVLGAIIGVPLGNVGMTAVPQRTALSHAFGALCVTLVGTAEFYLRAPNVPPFLMSVLSLEVILGGLTVTGSLMAAGKLQEILPQRPITYKGQNFVNLTMLAIAVAIAVRLVLHPEAMVLYPFMVGIALVFGVMMIVPIGGADMPTVISLLNSYAGLSAAAILSAANKVVIVPGYGMAVAQAQHKVRELYDLLTKKGVDVKFGIHPVAGRMPGHMNVLLAEADIPYDKLMDMDEANPDFPQTDVALVIGANDVTNPAARSDAGSPIYGMPILDVDKARTVMVIKRSMNPGFAGIDNPLYYLDNTLMLFGDAKAFVGSIVRELSGGGGHG